MSSVNLTHHFLIAMPAMNDPYFAHTLTYICRHNDEGALGLVVNRPIDLTLRGLFEQIDIPLSETLPGEDPIYYGGPVHMDRGFVLHAPIGAWQSTLAVNSEIGLTTSRDILLELGRGELLPQGMLITLGYAGWEAGQLERELSENSWLTVEASREVLFDLPAEDRVSAALDRLGINFAMLSDEAGHA
jgi:putative transcriptional regulator